MALGRLFNLVYPPFPLILPLPQNQRLTVQLREAATSEEQLQAQIQTLRDQFNVKKSSFNDNQLQMEALKQEVSEDKSQICFTDKFVGPLDGLYLMFLARLL